MRPFAALVVLLSGFLLLATPSQALYEEVGLTPIITDESEAGTFHDILGIALGETGDGRVLVKITVADMGLGTQLPTGSVDYWFTAPAGDFRAIFFADGSWTGGYEACEVDGNSAYCFITYDTLGVSIGDTITANRAISYLGMAQDYAPGMLYVPDGLLGPRGDDYVLVGSTVVGGEAPVLPTTHYEDLPRGEATAFGSFEEPTSDVFVFNWTTDTGLVLLEYGAEMSEGAALFTVTDGDGTELLSADITASIDLAETLDGAAGDWEFRYEFTDFVGDIGFYATPQAASEGETPVGDNATADPAQAAGPATTATTSAAPVQEAANVGDKKEESPGAGVLLLLAAVGIALVLRRR